MFLRKKIGYFYNFIHSGAYFTYMDVSLTQKIYSVAASIVTAADREVLPILPSANIVLLLC